MLERANDGAELDIGYLATLSDDVSPVVTEATGEEADPFRRDEVRLALRCGDERGGVATLTAAAMSAAGSRRSTSPRGERLRCERSTADRDRVASQRLRCGHQLAACSARGL